MLRQRENRMSFNCIFNLREYNKNKNVELLSTPCSQLGVFSKRATEQLHIPRIWTPSGYQCRTRDVAPASLIRVSCRLRWRDTASPKHHRPLPRPRSTSSGSLRARRFSGQAQCTLHRPPEEGAGRRGSVWPLTGGTRYEIWAPSLPLSPLPVVRYTAH